MTYEEQLFKLIQNDDRIVVMTAENRAAIRNLPELIGNKFIDVGIAEQTMVGGVPGFLSDGNGPTHQAIEDIGLMRAIPNMGIFCPSDNQDLIEGLPQLIESGRPFYLRYFAGSPVREHTSSVELGKAEVYPSNGESTEDDDVTILTYGFLLGEALEAQTILQAEGLKVRVLNMRTLSPIDEDAVFDAMENSHLVVTLEDHFLIGGLYSIISELFMRYGLIANVLPIAFDGKWFKPALLRDAMEFDGFTAQQITKKITTRLIEDGFFNSSRSSGEIISAHHYA